MSMETLLSHLAQDAVLARDGTEIEMSKLECVLHGVGVCRCPDCGAVVGRFPLGVVRGMRYGQCPCRPADGDRILFMMQRGYVRHSYFGCGHEYRHGDAEVMEYCPACTGVAPELL
jgi:hypothetical protein